MIVPSLRALKFRALRPCAAVVKLSKSRLIVDFMTLFRVFGISIDDKINYAFTQFFVLQDDVNQAVNNRAHLQAVESGKCL